MQKTISFRTAQKQDIPLILSFIRQLAEYERMLDEVVATEELLREWLFERKKAEVFFAVDGGHEVGFVLFFHNFSTFLGRAGIYLEDLFVLPEYVTIATDDERSDNSAGRSAHSRADRAETGWQRASGSSQSEWDGRVKKRGKERMR